jgi:hypothetical protein
MKSLPLPSFAPYRMFSSGWGVQSMAVMILQSQGKLNQPYDEYVWANVGDDSENPATIKYYHDVVIPFAAKHNIKLVERQKLRFGQPDTVYEATVRDNSSIPIPIVFPDSGFGNRTCTEDFKIKVVHDHAVKLKKSHVVMGIGFSTDERRRSVNRWQGWHNVIWTRDKKGQWKMGKRLGFWQLYEFPLLDLNMSRTSCVNIIEQSGLPMAPKSACWFCPFTSRAVWIDRKQQEPELFAKAVEFENALNSKYGRIRGHHPKASSFVGIHKDGISLADVPSQRSLWDTYKDIDEDGCGEVCGL